MVLFCNQKVQFSYFIQEQLPLQTAKAEHLVGEISTEHPLLNEP